MPNRRVHVATSTPAGAGYAFYKAKDINGVTKLPEVLGGALGGYLGGLLPDQIDPPFHPGHRSIGHGFFPVAAAAISWNHYLDSWQSRLRQLADEHSNHRSQSADPIVKAWHAFAALVLRLLSGFLAGIGAGYITHVALDSLMASCLPLVC